MAPAVTPGTGMSGSSRAATRAPRVAEARSSSALSGKGTRGQSWRDAVAVFLEPGGGIADGERVMPGERGYIAICVGVGKAE